MLKKLRKILGPGFISGAADDDPSGIGTYAQTGALFGFSQLWLALFSFPLMVSIQEMCGRVALSTEKGLTHALLRHYSKSTVVSAILLLLCANIFNSAANLSAMAASVQLLIPIPTAILVLFFTLLTASLIIFIPYRLYAKYLSILALTLMAYVITVFTIEVNWLEVFFATLMPRITFSKAYFINIVAFLGTTISPYLFFWQAAQEVEERKKTTYENENGGTGLLRSINDSRLDTIFGCFFSNIVAWFIMITAGATLFKENSVIETAADAANALRPLAGEWAFLLFTIGIVSTGLLALPVLAGSAAFAISEVTQITNGLECTFWQAKKFYSILVVIIGIASLFTVLPIGSMQLLYYSAVLNGICSAPLIFMILGVANNAEIMGKGVNGKVSNGFGYFTFVLITLCSALMFFSFFL